MGKMIKTLLMVVLGVGLFGCSTVYDETRQLDFRSELASIDSTDGLDPAEVSIIFGSYRSVCYPHTAFNIGDPAYYKEHWVAPVYIGDFVRMLSDEALVLEPKTGPLYFSKSNKVAVTHFKNIYVECTTQ